MAVTYIENITGLTTPATHLQRDVSWALSHLEPDRVPLDTLLRRVPRGPKPISTKIEWAEDDVYPRTDTVNTNAAQGTAAAAVNLYVDHASRWRVNDTIIVPSDKTKPTLLVTAIDASGAYITVYALSNTTDGNATTGMGTVPAFTAGDVIAWTGSTMYEGGTMTKARAVMPNYSYNYQELMDALVRYSKTRKEVKNYTNEQDIPRAKEQQLAEFRRSIEYKLWFQKASLTLDPVSSEQRWTMNGVTQYISNLFTFQKSVQGSQMINEAMLIDWLVQTWAGTNGSETRFLFADTYLMGELMKVDLTNLRLRQPTTVYGVKFERAEFNFGTLYVKHHRGFNEMGKNYYGCILDMEWIQKRDLRPMEKVVLALDKAGTDQEGEQYIEQTSVEVKHGNCHSEIQGL
jgi:hypothetical protein